MLSILLCSLAMTVAPTWTIDLSKTTVEVSPTLYGIFFEEINCAGDGGLYAELVRNRSFEDGDTPLFWRTDGKVEAKVASKPAGSPHDTRHLIVSVDGEGSLANEGYKGMGVAKGVRYVFEADLDTPLSAEVRLLDSGGKPIASAPWKPGEKIVLVPNETAGNATLEIRFSGKGGATLDHVSLFPQGTWKGRSSGLRNDLAQLLDDLAPAFVRFPGGCWVEGDTMAQAMRWKTTIGPVGLRRTQPNLWGYMSTNGLGYHEYLQLCEDLNAEPLFVINCGMSHKENVPMNKMDEYVQDALDAIEYANGATTTTWGARRAANGHPAPFGLKYLEIGNENGGPAYEERYGLMYRAIKAKFPQVHLIANQWGGLPNNTPVDIVDEHYYSDPEFFIRNADRYDQYDRKGPRIYVGEYAVTQGCGNGNLRGALAEGAFMMGMERNSDVVTHASYAPLFARMGFKAWNPDLIYFDSLESWGTPSYYVQQLFSRNRPQRIVKSSLKDAPIITDEWGPGAIGIGTWNTVAEFKDIRVESNGKVLFESENGEGGRRESGEWEQAKEFIRQTSGATPSRMVYGDPKWKSYTLTLHAKRLSGAEGFLITVGHRDSDNYIWFNVGGWGNRENAIELSRAGGKSPIGNHKPYPVETGKWLSIRIDYAPDLIRCFIDNVEVFAERPEQRSVIHTIAGVDAKGNPLLKIINLGSEAMPIDLDMTGGKSSFEATASVLFHPDDTAENTKDSPKRVFPKEAKLGKVGARFTYRTPPHSLSVIRLN